jgi:hypothetical protein
MTRRIDAVAPATGAGFAGLTDLACRRFPRQRAAGLSAGLSVAAAVYPLARTGGATRGRRIAAGGWLAHAVFEAIHDKGGQSRIPGWYPAA